MQQAKWFERKFDFTVHPNIFPSIIERLAGTPARLEEKVKNIPEKVLVIKPGNTWSIKEHIGHLTDLEPLWQGRFEDIVDGAAELRPTDLQNTKTTEANHNATPVEELLLQFRTIRAKTMQLLSGVDDEILTRSALHPRLKTPMRAIDLFLFVAEHDDHHLAAITAIVKEAAM